MKKILVLMLVLGIASTASAGLTFATSSDTILVGQTSTVSLLMDSAQAGAIGMDNIVGYFTSSVASLSLAAGSAVNAGVAINPQTAPYVGYYQTIMSTTTPGGFLYLDEIVVATLTGNAVGTYTIYVYDTVSWTTPPGPTDSFMLTVLVPEPMTIGLLGLGGLFLRRRK